MGSFSYGQKGPPHQKMATPTQWARIWPRPCESLGSGLTLEHGLTGDFKNEVHLKPMSFVKLLRSALFSKVVSPKSAISGLQTIRETTVIVLNFLWGYEEIQ